MSLMVYDRVADIPKGTPYIHNVGLFFDEGGTGILDTEEAKYLLDLIDNVLYVDYRSVQYPWKAKVYDASYLSGGLKVLLSILCRPDICFNADICGTNVLTQLMQFTSGTVYLTFPYVPYMDREHRECDIIWRGKHFNQIYKFLGYVADTLIGEDEGYGPDEDTM